MVEESKQDMCDIKTDEKKIKLFVYDINKNFIGKTMLELLQHFGYNSCNYSLNDKGLLGKLNEEFVFKNKPNNKSECDLKQLKLDIKSPPFKKLKNGNGINLKERVTLTNIGSWGKSETSNKVLKMKIHEVRKTKYALLF